MIVNRKTKNIALGILTAILLGNLLWTGSLNIRTVDFLQILAIGICAGVFLAGLFSKDDKPAEK